METAFFSLGTMDFGHRESYDTIFLLQFNKFISRSLTESGVYIRSQFDLTPKAEPDEIEFEEG